MPKNFTRGRGYLENFLAVRRARKADSLILPAQREGRILDIGCGRIPCFLMQTRFKEKFGVDPCAGALPEGTSITISALQIQDNTVLPYEKDFFDVVTMLGALEHFAVKETENLFRQIHRVLIPRGRFILTTPRHNTAGLLKLLAAARLISVEEIKGLKAAYPLPSLIALFEAAGFNKKKISFGCFQGGVNTWVYGEK